MATKTTMESNSMSLNKCRGNHIHILNCTKTTAREVARQYLKLSVLSWFLQFCAYCSGFHQNSNHCTMSMKTTMESKTDMIECSKTAKHLVRILNQL